MTSNQNNNGAQMGATGDANKLGLNLSAGAFVPSTTSTQSATLKLDSGTFTPQMNTEVPTFTPSGTASFNQGASAATSFYPGQQTTLTPPAAPSYDAGNSFQGQNNFYGQQQNQQYGSNGNTGNFGGNQQNFYNQQNQFNQFNQYGAGQQQFQQNSYQQQNVNYGASQQQQSFGGDQSFNNSGQQMYNNQNQGFNQNQSYGGGNQYPNKMGGGMNKPYNSGGPQQYNNQTGYQKNNNSYNSGGVNNQSYNQGPAQYKKKEPVSYNQGTYNKYEDKKVAYNNGTNNATGDFSGWQAPAGQKNSMANGKIKNVVTGTQQTMKPMTMSLGATPFKMGATFTPFQPKPVDVIAENLKKFDITDEEEIKTYKGYLKDLKKVIDEQNGVISLELFKNIGDLKLCKLETGIATSSNISYVKRTPEMLEQTKKQGHGKYPRRPQGQGNGGHQGGGGDQGNFDRDKRPKPQNQNNNYSPWLQVDNEEKKALQDAAKKYADKIKNSVKNDTQKIKLILNIIAPDNKEKKFGELRQYLFRGLKTQEECEDEGIEYVESEHKLIEGSNQINDEILELIVSNIIRKAQVEKEYCIFYGELCERKIQLELKLRGDSVKISNMKNSLFRKQLFNVCKICFEKFFDDEEREKNKKDLESTLKFQQKLFGNIEFVGELYRRKILPQSTLISVFDSLLGMSDVNDKLDDLILEGAINLMTKVGEAFEKNTNQVKKNQEESQQSFKKIVDRFQWAMDLKDETVVSNRIKLLVKNMFQDRKDGWKKTNEMNKGGPKTKQEVQKEVEDKYRAEDKARNQRDGNRGYGGDNRNNRDGYNNDRNKDKNYNDGGRRDGKPQYQKKDTGGGGSYGNGGRENRDAQKNNNRKDNNTKRADQPPKQEIIQLDDDEMGKMLKKNFEDYANKKKMAEEGMVEEEEGEKQEIAADLSIYEKVKVENGKNPALILFSLLCQIFDEDMQKVDNYFSGYLDALITKKTFSNRDFGEGISKFVQFMPEIVLDVPQVHQYLFKNVIDPLNRKGLLKLKFIKWTAEPKEKPAADDDDDIVFDASDSQLKLMALLLKDYKNGEKDPRSWDDVFKWFDTELKWLKTVKDKQEKIEDGDDLWSAMKDDLGSDMAPVIIPLLKGDKAEALKNVK